MLPSAGIKASADWSQNVEAQSPCNPACSLSTLRSLMLYSNAVTDRHARLATGGWLTLARLASHQLDYSPFVWAHNPDLCVSNQNEIPDLSSSSSISKSTWICPSTFSPRKRTTVSKNVCITNMSTNWNLSESKIAFIAKALRYQSTLVLSSICNLYIQDLFSPIQSASF